MDKAGAANQSYKGDQLLMAASKNQFETIRLLITEHGIPASYANGVGQSALHIACLWGHVEAVRTLVELGANVSAKNTMTGASPLHMAAQGRKGPAKTHDRVAIVECLVRAGAAKDQLDNMGNLPADCPTLQEEEYAPLLRALRPSAPSIVQALENTDFNALTGCLEQDSSAASAVFMGKTPVMKIVDDILDELNDGSKEKEMAPSSGAGSTRCTSRSEEMLKCLKVLLDHGASTELVEDAAATGLDESPFHQLLAAMLDESQHHDRCDSMLLSAVGYLIESGAIMEEKKIVALFHLAARRDQVPFARYCIETLRIDPNLQGRQGMTAVQFAARSGRIAMLEYLLGLPGIDPTIADDRGTTPLQAARVNNRTEAIALLEKLVTKDA